MVVPWPALRAILRLGWQRSGRLSALFVAARLLRFLGLL
jgi:hypothetical protein